MRVLDTSYLSYWQGFPANPLVVASTHLAARELCPGGEEIQRPQQGLSYGISTIAQRLDQRCRRCDCLCGRFVLMLE